MLHLLYHAPFFLLTEEGPSLPCLAVMHKQVISIHLAGQMLTSTECNLKVQNGAASAEGGKGALRLAQDLLGYFPHCSPIRELWASIIGL